jgi:hypothetical protein
MNKIEEKNVTKKIKSLMRLTGATPDCIINIAKGMMKTYRYTLEIALSVMERQLISQASKMHTTVKDILSGMKKADKMTMEDYLPEPKTDPDFTIAAKTMQKTAR